MPTLKTLPVAITLALDGVKMSAAVAGLRGVGRGNKEHRNPSNCSLVVHKQPELVERPVVSASTLSFASRLLIETFSDTRQVFKRQGCILQFGFLHQLSTDVVIHPRLKALLPPREPSHQSATGTSAFGLNTASDLGKSVTSGLNLFATPTLVSAGRGNISASKINPNHLRGLARRGGVNLYDAVDGVVTLAGFVQGGAGDFLPSQQRNLIAANGQLEPMALRQGDAHFLSVFPVAKGSLVQTDRSGAEFVNLLDRFHVPNDAPNRHANMVRTQPRRTSHRFIGQMVQLGRIPLLRVLSNLEDLITSISKTLKRCVNFSPQLFRDYKLTFY